MGDEFTPHVVEALNTQTGEVERLPNDQAFTAFQSGNYRFLKNAEIKVFNKFGAPHTITAEHLPSAMSEGFVPASDDQQKEIFLQKKYGDRPLAAAAIGAARGLTGRLSDVALTKTGLVEPETISEIAERNPAITTGFEVAGTVAPLVLTGGAAAAGEAAAQTGARGALATASKFTAPSILSKVGQAIEKPIAEAITSKLAAREALEATTKTLVASGATKQAAKSVARLMMEQALPRGVGSAVEGAFYGGGQLLSENALGDSELNAETIMSHVGLGALLGGATGVFTSGAGVLYRRGADKFLKKFGASLEEELVEGGAGAKVPRETSAPVIETEKTTPLQKNIAKEFPGSRPQEIKRVMENSDDFFNTPTMNPDPNYVAPNGAKPKKILDVFREDLQKLDMGLEQRELETQYVVGNLKEKIPVQELKNVFQKQIDELAPGGNAITPTEEKAVNVLKRHMDLLDQSGKADMTGEETRQYLQRVRKGIQSYKSQRLPGAPEHFEETQLKDVTHNINEMLRGFVKKSGNEGFSKAMDTYSKEVQLKKAIVKNFRLDPITGEPGLGSDWFKNRVVTPLQNMYEGGSGAHTKWSQLMMELGEATGTDWKKIVENNLIFAKIFPEQATEMQAGPWSRQMLGVGKKVLHAVRHPGEALAEGAANVVERFLPGSSARQQAAREVILSGAAETVKNKVGFLSSAERIIAGQAENINQAMKGMLSEKGQRTMSAGATKALLSVSFQPKKGGETNRRTAFANRHQELSDLVTNPVALTDRLTKSVGRMSAVAPNLTTQIQQKASTAVKYLHDNAPKDPLAGMNLVDSRWEPSDTDLSQFERRLHAIENPLSVLEDAKAGLVTQESVEALQVVYPKLYEQMRTSLVNQIAENKNSIPYQTRVQLSILFDTPMDSTMRPDFIQLMQKPSVQEPAQKGGRTRKGELGRAGAMQTNTERLERRAM